MKRAFYISSKGVTSAEAFADAPRSHCGIEISLHWVLDVTFRENDCRVRKDHAPHNFATLRKFALALLRQDAQYPKRSLRPRRKTAVRIPDYRASLLGLTPRRKMRLPWSACRRTTRCRAIKRCTTCSAGTAPPPRRAPS